MSSSGPSSGTEGASADYAAFVQSITPHLDVRPLRPLLGFIPRWVVTSITWPDTFRPVVAWGSQTRARNCAQPWHAAHARARESIARGDDSGLSPPRVEREAVRIWADRPDLAATMTTKGDGR